MKSILGRAGKGLYRDLRAGLEAERADLGVGGDCRPLLCPESSLIFVFNEVVRGTLSSCGAVGAHTGE